MTRALLLAIAVAVISASFASCGKGQQSVIPGEPPLGSGQPMTNTTK